MADEQDPAASGSTPPAKKAAKKAPAKRKTPAKKAPTKAAKKAPAQKAPPTPIPPAPPEPVPAPEPVNLAETNGEARRQGADEAAAQAKKSIESAGDSLTGPGPLSSGIAAVRLPAALALALALLLAILLIRRLRAS